MTLNRRRIVAAIAIVLVLAGGVLVYRMLRGGLFSAGNFEEPAYSVISKEGDFEVRSYRGYVVAETTISAPFEQATRRSFRPLFRYISGSNQSRTKVDMTAPVLVEPLSEKMAMTVPVLVEPQRGGTPDGASSIDGVGIDGWTMAFILPEDYTFEMAPTPTSSRVGLREVGPSRVATVRFNGRFSNKRGEAHRVKLEEWLSDQGLQHLGDWKLASYDPPFTLPMLRRNEVLVTLR